MPTSSEALETTAVLPATVALHARPAADFVRMAMRFEAEISIAAGDREADAKSLLAVLGLGATAGTSVCLTASGADAEEALASLAACISSLE
jgi:phosphocarrier protein HPr